MDIGLARTFLEVVASGSFVVASERLHVTQTAVSSRIRTLEDHLGRRLFVRNKAGARLTPAGERFRKFATTLVQVWERARHQVALPTGRSDVIGIGAELSLWTPFMANWLIWMHRKCPEVAIRVDVDLPSRLVDGLLSGSLDVAVVYGVVTNPELVSELLTDEKLVMVTSARDGTFDPSSYVHVDWGTSFRSNFDNAFPDLALPSVTISLGPLALSYVLAVGGCGYFRLGAVLPYIKEKKLKVVKDAPEFSYSVHAVYSRKNESAALDRVRHGLRLTTASTEAPAPRGRSPGARRGARPRKLS
jgi:DNA-binding transcriptional LysR family regulator